MGGIRDVLRTLDLIAQGIRDDRKGKVLRPEPSHREYAGEKTLWARGYEGRNAECVGHWVGIHCAKNVGVKGKGCAARWITESLQYLQQGTLPTGS